MIASKNITHVKEFKPATVPTTHHVGH
jgi:hypothetical protein